MLPSEHTRLINRFIGLCKNTIGWPNTLGELGYDVQLIEQEISLEDASRIHPDVIAVSNTNLHALVTDCKSGKNLEKDQLDRYKKLIPKDLHKWLTTYDNNRLTHTVCIANCENNCQIQRKFTNFPFLTFYSDKIIGDGDLGYKDLNAKFSSPVSLIGMHEPLSYYPFSHEDHKNVIAPHVLRGLISFLVKKGHKDRPKALSESTAEAILEIVHPFTSYISTRHKDSIRKVILEIIKLAINSNNDFKEQVSKLENGDFNYATLKSLSSTCEKMAQEFETQRRITDEYS